MKTILLLEDHDDTRQMMLAILKEAYQGCLISTASTIGQASSLLDKENYNLAIVDISLPDGSGMQIIDRLHREESDTYMVVMSIYDDDRHIEDALKRGANGYLLKDQPRQALLDAFKDITRGIPALAPVVARRLILRLQNGTDNVDNPLDPTLATLSPREREVLTLIAKGLGRGEISELLHITQNTVSGYVKAIYRKLEINSRAEAVLYAVKNKLIC